MDKPRLYNLDTDIGERTDVAADHPDVVNRLKALALKMAAELGDGQPGPEVRPAGYVENAVTLYPTEDEPKKGDRKDKTAGKRGELDTLKIGDTLSGDDAPQVAGRPLTIACDVETTATSGVILAHGGVSTGYTLYLKEGLVVFAVHQAGGAITRIMSADVLHGKTALEARLAADGTMTLSLNHQVAASGKCDGPLKNQPKEDFCVGHDNRMTVDTYDGKTMFQGVIEHLSLSTRPQP
jgi:hypothetical protein